MIFFLFINVIRMAEKYFSPPYIYPSPGPSSTRTILLRPSWNRLNHLRTGQWHCKGASGARALGAGLRGGAAHFYSHLKRVLSIN